MLVLYDTIPVVRHYSTTGMLPGGFHSSPDRYPTSATILLCHAWGYGSHRHSVIGLITPVTQIPLLVFSPSVDNKESTKSR